MTIEASSYVVKGKLIDYRDSKSEGHLPNILIVQNENGRHILRTWSIIKKEVS